VYPPAEVFGQPGAVVRLVGVAIVLVLVAVAGRHRDDHLAASDALHLGDDSLCLARLEVFQHLAAQDGVERTRAEGQKPHVAADQVVVDSGRPALEKVGAKDVRPHREQPPLLADELDGPAATAAHVEHAVGAGLQMPLDDPPGREGHERTQPSQEAGCLVHYAVTGPAGSGHGKLLLASLIWGPPGA
jgi:hypothetical protein